MGHDSASRVTGRLGPTLFDALCKVFRDTDLVVRNREAELAELVLGRLLEEDVGDAIERVANRYVNTGSTIASVGDFACVALVTLVRER